MKPLLRRGLHAEQSWHRKHFVVVLLELLDANRERFAGSVLCLQTLSAQQALVPVLSLRTERRPGFAE